MTPVKWTSCHKSRGLISDNARKSMIQWSSVNVGKLFFDNRLPDQTSLGFEETTHLPFNWSR